MINQIDSGATIVYANASGSTISAGDIVVFGKMIGIAVADILNGAEGVLSVDGKYQLTKKTATDELAQGTVLVYDSGVKAATAASTLDAVIVGRVAGASANGDTTVDTILGL